MQGGGALLIGQPGDRSGSLGSGGHARAVILLTTSRAFVLKGRRGHLVTVGMSSHWLPRAHAIGRVRGVTILRAGNVIAGVTRRRVSYLGDFNSRAIRTKHALLTRLGRAQ